MIQLYTDMSPHAWKVPVALEEMGLPYEVNHISLASGATKSPEYRKISPWGVVPTIVDQDEDDLVVIESGAILIYLAEKSGRSSTRRLPLAESVDDRIPLRRVSRFPPQPPCMQGRVFRSTQAKP